MTYAKPEMLVLGPAHLNILEAHPCAHIPAKSFVFPDDCQFLSDGAYGIDE